MLSLPPSNPSDVDTDVETLPPPAVLASMEKIINGRTTTENSFFLTDPKPENHLAWCRTFEKLVEK